MPRGKPKNAPSQTQRQSQHEADDEMLTQTATQAQRAASAIPSDELERKVNDLVQYLLVMDQKKIPVKRQDINKNVLKEHTKAFTAIMAKAKERLSKVFGIEVVELEGKQLKSYILVNQHDVDMAEMHASNSESDYQRMGLLMVVLSVIFMNNNVMHDAQLYAVLKNLGVDVDKPHSAFGDVKKLLSQEFVRQAYLEMSRQPASEPPTYEFRWGQRARHELSKRKCLEFVSKVYGMQDATQWTSQWSEVLREEGAASAGSDAVVI